MSNYSPSTDLIQEAEDIYMNMLGIKQAIESFLQHLQMLKPTGKIRIW